MLPDLYKYAFDPSGKALSNRVTNEFHDLSTDTNRILALSHGPFYTEGLLVTRLSGVSLVRNIDYKPLYLYQEATEATGREVCTAIVLLKDSFTEDLNISYQVVGGKYGGEGAAIHEIVENLDQYDLSTTWDLIKFKPTEFRPRQHLHNAADLIGMGPVRDELVNITEAVKSLADEDGLTTQAAIKNRVSRMGHQKLIVDEGDIYLDDHTGPIELTFGRSNTQNAQMSIEIRVISNLGTDTYIVTGSEIESTFEHVVYADTGGGGSLPMLLRTVDGTSNQLILGGLETVWKNSYIVISGLIVNTGDPDAYVKGYNWSKEVLGTFPELALPVIELDGELGVMQDSIRKLADLLNTHIQNNTNPHGNDIGQFVTESELDEFQEDTDDSLEELSVRITTQIHTLLDRGYTF